MVHNYRACCFNVKLSFITTSKDRSDRHIYDRVNTPLLVSWEDTVMEGGQHENMLHNMCRLCQRSSLGNKVRKLVNMKAHCDFINNHYLQVNFNTEDRARYPQNICNSCFQALYYSMNKEKLFVSKQKKLPKAQRTEFVIDNKITIVDDGDWDHNENCKVCYNDIIQQQQHEVEEPKSPEPPSPGTVKRKEIDSFLTPQAKKAQRNKSGSGQPRQLFLKS